MLYFVCYLTSGAIFYWFAAKFAPVIEEPAFEQATHPSNAEVIELFGTRADQAAKKAA